MDELRACGGGLAEADEGTKLNNVLHNALFIAVRKPL